MSRVHRDTGLRQKLLDAARALLDAEGIEGVTVRACARAAGVSHAAPGKHFADRRALLTALAIDCMADLDADVLARMEHAADPRAQLTELADASVGYALVHPNRYRLMWRTDLLDSQNAELLRHTGRIFGQVEAIAAALPPQPVSRETQVIAICSALHGYISMRIDRNFRPASDEVVPRLRHLAIVDLLLGGSG
jgi:AcrR family transcriptional regulator